MSAEVKHYYFDSATYGSGVHFANIDQTQHLVGIKYIPKDWPQYKVAVETGQPYYSTNFVKVFDPMRIFPKISGSGAVDSIIGNKFKWLSTMIDLEIKSTGILSLYTIPCQNSISSITESVSTSSTGQTTSTRSGPLTYNVSHLLGTQMVINRADGGTGYITATPGAAANVDVVSQISQTEPYNEWTEKQEVTLINQEGVRIRQGYSTVRAPMLMTPAFRPYYYCRFVVLRMNVSFTDYIALKDNPTYWRNFFNGLWWDRSSVSVDGAPRRHMSQRVNDYNVTNPFGGMFDIVCNKKLKVNPFKTYRFRYNLKSARRGGDLITIKTDNPLVPLPEVGNIMYNNGNYFGFVLGPLCLDDFDVLTQQYIYAQSPYEPDHGVLKEFMRGVNDTRNNWSDPHVELGNLPYNYVLKCGDTSLYARTAYLD